MSRHGCADALWFLAWAVASSAWCLTSAAQIGPTFDEPIYLKRGSTAAPFQSLGFAATRHHAASHRRPNAAAIFVGIGQRSAHRHPAPISTVSFSGCGSAIWFFGGCCCGTAARQAGCWRGPGEAALPWRYWPANPACWPTPRWRQPTLPSAPFAGAALSLPHWPGCPLVPAIGDSLALARPGHRRQGIRRGLCPGVSLFDRAGRLGRSGGFRSQLRPVCRDLAAISLGGFAIATLYCGTDFRTQPAFVEGRTNCPRARWPPAWSGFRNTCASSATPPRASCGKSSTTSAATAFFCSARGTSVRCGIISRSCSPSSSACRYYWPRCWSLRRERERLQLGLRGGSGVACIQPHFPRADRHSTGAAAGDHRHRRPGRRAGRGGTVGALAMDAAGPGVRRRLRTGVDDIGVLLGLAARPVLRQPTLGRHDTGL